MSNRKTWLSTEKISEQLCEALNNIPAEVKNRIDSIIVYGSLVRGDFWRSSDVDLMVVAKCDADSSITEKELRLSLEKLSFKADVWRTNKNQLTNQRPLRAEVRIIQFGLYGFDTVANHKVIWGKDLVAGFPVPKEAELKEIARIRVKTLLQCECNKYPQEMNKWACEGAKAGVIYYCINQGRAPTRNKRRVPGLFRKLVPSFPEKGFFDKLWEEYKKGSSDDKDGFFEDCHDFLKGLSAIINKEPI